MTTGLPLFDFAPRSAEEQSFVEFHGKNPEVYRRLCELARLAKSRGRRRIGIRLLWERLRWDLTVETERPEDAPKLNDHFTARFARLLMQQEPDLAGFFETRDHHH